MQNKTRSLWISQAVISVRQGPCVNCLTFRLQQEQTTVLFLLWKGLK